MGFLLVLFGVEGLVFLINVIRLLSPSTLTPQASAGVLPLKPTRFHLLNIS